MLEKYRGSYLRSHSPLEEQGHRFLTPYAFKKFQEEFGRATQYMAHEITQTRFIVNYHKGIQAKNHEVVWDGKIAKCSCKNFEFVGILCRHILKVLIREDCFEIPPTYLISRWSREEVFPSNEIEVINSTSVNIHMVVSDAIDVVQHPPISKTKGRPSETRLKRGSESIKKGRRCSLCRGVGHKITTCSERGKINKNDATSVNASKKKKIVLEDDDPNPILTHKC